jgi:hypothetical protein
MEAGTCFALGRYTASVYHAMCALEPAIASLAKKMKVQHSERRWKTVLDEVGKAIRVAQTQAKGAARTRRLDFLAEAAEQFNWIKDAWRNHTMHARAKYDRGTSESILEHVQGFMEHMARWIA